MLKQRIITALILIPLFLLLLFFSSAIVFFIVTLIIVCTSAFEWCNLVVIQKPINKFFYLLLFIFLSGGLLFFNIPILLMMTCFFWVIALLLVIFYEKKRNDWHHRKILRGALGFIVLIPTWIALNYIRIQSGSGTLCFLFVIIWAADTIAFFVGRRFGKHKIAPMISPGKSWEGFIAALIGCLILSAIILIWSNLPQAIYLSAILLTGITVFAALLGDLFESMLKRQVNLKDSGHLLPGHGGLLDRLDSLTASAPIFAFGTFLILNFLSR